MPSSLLLSSCGILGLPLPHLKVNSRGVIHSTCFPLHSICLCIRSLFPVSGTISLFQAFTPFLLVHHNDKLTSFPCLFLLPWFVESSTKVFFCFVLFCSGHTLLRHIHILSHIHTYMFTHALMHVHTHSPICPHTLTLCSLGCGFTTCETGSVITTSPAYGAV